MMTDHAKALADALRFVSEHALTSTARIDLKTKADKALAAYDATTRENGDDAAMQKFVADHFAAQNRNMMAEEIRGGIHTQIWLTDAFALMRAYAALSTHQQQGAENGELVERLRTLMNNLDSATDLPDGWDEVLEDCADALSRASQPDTVTEEMVEAMSRAHSPELWAKIDKFADDDDWNGATSINARNMAMRDMRAALSHQQQGDVKLIGRLRDIADALASECHPRSTVEAITEAADALSRAPLIPVDPVNPYNHEDRQRLHDAAHTPQPDTVTDERLAELSVQFCKEQNLFISIEAQARLVEFAQFVTAALARNTK